jgi:hypothetical protein
MRTEIFSSGMRASRDVKIAVARGSQTLYAMDDTSLDVFYIVETDTQETLQRQDKSVYRLLDGLFLASTPGTAAGLQNLVKKWPSDNISAIGWWLQDLQADDDTDEPLRFLDVSATKDLSHFVIFVLGYYYAVLKPLLNTTQLAQQEAIGSWGWDDIQVLRVLRRFKLSADSDNEGRFARHEVLRLLGYMFTGASWTDQLRYIPEQSVGVLGKLTLVTGSLMGEADCPEKIEKFWLLDIDPTCIPSTQNGFVLSGRQSKCTSVETQASVAALDLSSDAPPAGDFTSHIEPDWDHDVQRVLVAYRQDGRIVHRLSPFDSDIAVLKSWIEPSEVIAMELPRAVPVKLDEFIGGFTAKRASRNNVDPGDEAPLVVLTRSMTKARTCITGMYGANVAVLCSNSLTKAAAHHSPEVIIA